MDNDSLIGNILGSLIDNKNCCCNDGCNRGYGYDGFGGQWIWVIFLLFIMMFAGRGWDRRDDRNCASQQDVATGFGFQNIDNAVRNVERGVANAGYNNLQEMNRVNENVSQQGYNTMAAIAAMNANLQNCCCDVRQELSNGFGNNRYDLSQGFGNTRYDMSQGFCGVTRGIDQARFDMQNCCCETNRNIDSVKFEAAQNTCAITTNATANTQRVLDKLCQMEANAKDQQIDELRTNLQAAQLQLGQLSQTNTLIDALRPCSRPAYITCSPYESYNFPFYNNNCNCNQNRCCG